MATTEVKQKLSDVSDKSIDEAHFVLPDDQPVVYLDANEAFNAMSDSEKRYAHHLSRYILFIGQ